MANVPFNNEDINRFWLQMLADSALIILDALSASETDEIQQASALADRFEALIVRAEAGHTAEQMTQLNKDAFQAAQDMRRFNLTLIREYLSENIYLSLKPALLSYFVKETERYMDLLHAFMQNRTPEFKPIQEEIFWLPVFMLQSNYIANNMGYYMKKNRETAIAIADTINEYAAFSKQLLGYSRIGTADFPIAIEHHRDVVTELSNYYEFLTSLLALQQQESLPGSMTLLYLDRSRRMVCFFLRYMSLALNTMAPECNPYSLRISSF